MSRFTKLAAAAAALTLAACADSTPITSPSDSPDAIALDPGGAANPDIRHIFPTIQAQQNAGNPGGGGASQTISYHGGPVLLTGTNVAAIYWAGSTIYNGGPAPNTTGAGADDGSLIGAFMRGLGGSPYFNINTTYTDGSGNPIASIVNYTQFWANGSFNVPSGTQTVSDGQMVAMLQYAFDNGKLTYDPSTLYNIFTAGKVNLGGGFGTQYCAYHYHGTVTINGSARTVLYSAMPYDYAYPSSCSANLAVWPNGDAGADAEVNTLAHEIEETTTDLMGNAWYDRRGYENADKCAWQFGTTFTTAGAKWNVVVGGRNWLVQMNWAAGGGCLNKL
jgi:hypothetical protein